MQQSGSEEVQSGVELQVGGWVIDVSLRRLQSYRQVDPFLTYTNVLHLDYFIH